MNDLAVLVLGDEGDDGRPTVAHLLARVDELALGRVDDALGLEPASKAAATRARGAGHQVSQEQPLVRMTAAAKKKQGARNVTFVILFIVGIILCKNRRNL